MKSRTTADHMEKRENRRDRQEADSPDEEARRRRHHHHRGRNAAIDTPQHAVEIAHDIGYPGMLKASAGGGQGPRVAWDEESDYVGSGV